MYQYVTMNANTGVAPPNSALVLAVLTGAQPTVIPLAPPVGAVAAPIIWQTAPGLPITCHCPHCGGLI